MPGRASDPWRYETLGIMWRALNLVDGDAYGDTTYIDWIEPFIDLDQVRGDRPGFGRMLLYDADPKRMGRNWIRWAVRFLQIAARVQLSNARDEQIASYMPDVDLFFTTDKTYFGSLELSRLRRPCPVRDPSRLTRVPVQSRRRLRPPYTACPSQRHA